MDKTTPYLQKVSKKLLSKAFLVKASIAVVILAIIAFIAIQVISDWSEIMFTFEHPQLVKQLHAKYDEKTAAVEKGLVNDQPSAQDKLIQTLTDELQQQSKK